MTAISVSQFNRKLEFEINTSLYTYIAKINLPKLPTHFPDDNVVVVMCF